MGRTLKKRDILEILYGAAFMSTGAGGTLTTGLRMLSDFERENEISVEMISCDEMEENTYAAIVLGYGSPDAFLDTAFGREALTAFSCMKKELRKEGKEISALYSLEYAGFNTLTPIYAAMKNDIPILDADCNAKAIPSLDKSLYTVKGGKTGPVFMGSETGDCMIFRPADPPDFNAVNRVIYKMSEAYDLKIGMAVCAIPKADVARLTITGALSLAQQVGKAVLENAEQYCDGHVDLTGEKLMKKIRSAAGETAYEICRGPVVRLIKDASAAYNRGTVVIENEGDGRRYYVDFKNENLLVRTDEGVILTVPDNICTYLADSGIPITNSELAEKMRIGICAVPAPRQWHATKAGFDLYRDMLEEAGYTGEKVSL